MKDRPLVYYSYNIPMGSAPVLVYTLQQRITEIVHGKLTTYWETRHVLGNSSHSQLKGDHHHLLRPSFSTTTINERPSLSALSSSLMTTDSPPPLTQRDPYERINLARERVYEERCKEKRRVKSRLYQRRCVFFLNSVRRWLILRCLP